MLFLLEEDETLRGSFITTCQTQHSDTPTTHRIVLYWSNTEFLVCGEVWFLQHLKLWFYTSSCLLKFFLLHWCVIVFTPQHIYTHFYHLIFCISVKLENFKPILKGEQHRVCGWASIGEYILSANNYISSNILGVLSHICPLIEIYFCM